MSDPELRGTLSAYARWAGISIQAACMRNKRGKIVMCDDYPYLVDFVRTNIANEPGAPKKPRMAKKFRVVLYVTPEQYKQIQRVMK